MADGVKEIPRRNLKFCEVKGCVSCLFKVSTIEDDIVIRVVEIKAYEQSI